ncbi:MAG TPA: ABC transporter ATP-binding protein [Phycisphaerae bacterium]|nr:ABC transporter ATP-binding protein [Phycisphaerae bacterium]HRY70567.1 ABC transporter ATP-binding protein [Phycisphaerae bacterium]HSA28383.1 ABC transporter ATP-binding protein [Phycisphaerae bacterium]
MNAFTPNRVAEAVPNLCAESLGKAYPSGCGPLVVLRDVSLGLRAGESIAIMGPSGSGKSTLLHILGTLEPPSSGRVTLAGCDPFSLPADELAAFRNRSVGFIFQDHHLLPQCTVLENVLIPTLAGAARDDVTTRARQLLDRLGLAERLDHLPAELSGGERQRVAIARAMINRPLLLLADEPTGNLDRHSADAVGVLLHELYREESAMLVVVTHSPVLAERFGRRYELSEHVLREV